ncbi:MAG: L-histidine N(alpha)-methyltransferase [Rudaea sp.]
MTAGADLRRSVGGSCGDRTVFNDNAGVTAELTLNRLARFNRDLDACFDSANFRQRARYNALAGRIHQVSVDGKRLILSPLRRYWLNKDTNMRSQVSC